MSFFFKKKVVSWYWLLLGFALPSISTSLCHSLGWGFAKIQKQSQGCCVFLAPCGNSCLSHPCGWEETWKQPRPSSDRNSPHHPQPHLQDWQIPPGIETETSREGKNQELEMKRGADWQEGTSTWLQTRDFFAQGTGEFSFYWGYVAKKHEMKSAKRDQQKTRRAKGFGFVLLKTSSTPF